MLSNKLIGSTFRLLLLVLSLLPDRAAPFACMNQHDASFTHTTAYIDPRAWYRP